MNHIHIFIFLVLFSFFQVRAQSTASPQVTKIEIEAPQLDTLKKVWIYLPKTYATSSKRYPVIYMHDAQNLFDRESAYAGEWMVDESLDSLKSPEAIVVGIEHGGEKRIDELTPFPNEKYGGGRGDDYLDFIVSNLKPYIDSKYRTRSGRLHTTIFGSSLGGLISYYAALKYPEVFGKAGVYSPSFWFNDKIYDYARQTKLPRSTKFYFLVGGDESEEMVPDLRKMVALLKEKGVKENRLRMKVVPNGQHNEALWSDNFPETFIWLMK